MESKYAVIGSVLLLLVISFLGACSTGIPEEEYNALVDKYNSLQLEHDALQKEHDMMKLELASLQEQVTEYEERLLVAHSYAVFYDAYTDLYRWKKQVPTKYGYTGPDDIEQDYMVEFFRVAYQVGGEEFYESVLNAFNLPQGEEKDKAWAEFHIRLAENMVEATTP